MCQKATLLGVPTKETLSVPTGVPNLKRAKVNKMYQNSLGMMPVY